MIRLRVKAPFAAFRTFTAGSFRPTAPFLTPSAAYGLVLNIAGIESRYDDGAAPMTLMATGLPSVELALGAYALPEVQSLYQQLHNYPVGSTGKERLAEARGNKYNIQPVRREFLSNLDACICLRANEGLEDRVRHGLQVGTSFAPDGKRRYGIPFLGDNNFLISVLQEEIQPSAAYWFTLLRRGDGSGAEEVCRLTVWIDRQDMARTVSRLYVRSAEPSDEIPEDAWTRIEPPG